LNASPASGDAIALKDIHKSFGPIHANRGVTLHVPAGAITGIVGENGAGKSTLMGVLYGLHAADRGEVRVFGEAVRLRSPRDALARGIGMVHQHFKLVDTFTAVENVMLGAEGGLRLTPGLAATRATLMRLKAAYALDVDLDARVGDLAVGARQRIEILKVLARGARVLILDEPTAVLTPAETEGLFAILRALRADGLTVILISHKLKEVMALTDRVAVMRAGEVVAERATAQTSAADLAELMVGRKLRLDLARGPARPGPVRLAARGLTVRDAAGIPLLHDVDVVLRAGEIVGVAGVSGNGQDALLDALAGIRPLAAGQFTVGGRTVTPEGPADPAAMRTLGVAHVPEDRQRAGLVAAFTAAENAVLGYHDRAPAARGWRLDRAAIRRRCADLMARFDVRPPRPESRLGGFSGGNQQKLVVARELEAGAQVLLVGQPTRGVDVGAIALLHRSLVAARDTGAAILVVSAELDEILALSDRVMVMLGGRVVGEVPAAEADERRIGALMGGLAAA
jgi:general nucleoside transport system ATP-binding protein